MAQFRWHGRNLSSKKVSNLFYRLLISCKKIFKATTCKNHLLSQQIYRIVLTVDTLNVISHLSYCFVQYCFKFNIY